MLILLGEITPLNIIYILIKKQCEFYDPGHKK